MKAVFIAPAALLSVATAQSLCAVNCFQSVVTEHPPLSCKEDNMYLCFCKGKDLQSYFAECVYSKCGGGASEAINFGVGLCKDLGVPINVPTPPSVSTASLAVSSPVPTPSSVGLATPPSAGSSEGTTTTTVLSKSDAVETPGTTAVATTATTIAPSASPQPSGPKNQTGIQSSPSTVVVNQGVDMKAGPAMLAAVGVGAAVVHLF